MKWTRQRCSQLVDLHKVLQLAGSLNKGSDVVAKIKELEELCSRLRKSDDTEPSFTNFLNELAVADRSGHE